MSGLNLVSLLGCVALAALAWVGGGCRRPLPWRTVFGSAALLLAIGRGRVLATADAGRVAGAERRRAGAAAKRERRRRLSVRAAGLRPRPEHTLGRALGRLRAGRADTPGRHLFCRDDRRGLPLALDPARGASVRASISSDARALRRRSARRLGQRLFRRRIRGDDPSLPRAHDPLGATDGADLRHVHGGFDNARDLRHLSQGLVTADRRTPDLRVFPVDPGGRDDVQAAAARDRASPKRWASFPRSTRASATAT